MGLEGILKKQKASLHDLYWSEIYLNPTVARLRTVIDVALLDINTFFGSVNRSNGKTPTEACGIEVQGQDKWKTIIQNASI